MVTDDEQYRQKLLNAYFGHLTDKLTPKKDVTFINNSSGGLYTRPETASTSFYQNNKLKMSAVKSGPFNMLQKTYQVYQNETTTNLGSVKN